METFQHGSVYGASFVLDDLVLDNPLTPGPSPQRGEGSDLGFETRFLVVGITKHATPHTLRHSFSNGDCEKAAR